MIQERSYFNPDDFLILANKLIDDNDYTDESRYRTVIGRAYYSAFLTAYKKFLEKGRNFPNVDRIHMDVRKALQNEMSKIGNKLEKLHEDYRVPSDYYLVEHIDRRMAEDSIRLSQIIISAIKNI